MIASYFRNKLPLIVVLVILILTSGCSLRYKTLDEAIEKDIPYEVKEILHIESLTDHAIVLYLTPVDLPTVSGVDTHAVAFIYGSDEKGGKNEGPNGWHYYQNNDMTLYIETAAYSYSENTSNERLQVVFGQIHNKDIKNVKVAGLDNFFVDADIIERLSGRYYFKVGKYQIVQGLSENGEVLHQQGG